MYFMVCTGFDRVSGVAVIVGEGVYFIFRTFYYFSLETWFEILRGDFILKVISGLDFFFRAKLKKNLS